MVNAMRWLPWRASLRSMPGRAALVAMLIAVALCSACTHASQPLPSVMSLSELREQMQALRLSCQPEERLVIGRDTFINQQCVSLGTGGSGFVNLSFRPQVIASPKYFGGLCGNDPVV